MIRSTLLAIPCWISFSVPAFAHVGHIGELAGHAHWLAIGSAIAAAALAAAVAKQKGKKNEVAEEQTVEGETADGETG